MSYAENTSVSVEKSKAEIERTLERYGATEFMYGTREREAIVAFKIEGFSVRFLLPLPGKDEKRFWQTETRRTKRTADQALKLWEQACRQKWRALALCIKAKLEACESGITVLQQEFLAHIVAPDGRTVGETVIPQLAESKTPLLPNYPEAKQAS